MEDNYPEIALKQPKADPRTVQLKKISSIKPSSDHIQDYYRKCNINYAATLKENSYNATNTYKFSKLSITSNAFNYAKINVESVAKMSIDLASASASSNLSSSSQYLIPTTSSSPSWLSSLLLSTLVNLTKSCHFNASFIRNYLYQTQKKSLIFFLLLIWCAIFIQTTQALPRHRLTAPDRKLILHTNSYRERYHQKLLEKQTQHNQYQQLLQLQLQKEQRHQQVEKPDLEAPKLSYPVLPLPPKLHYQKQVQNNRAFLSGLARHNEPSHRHHLHQRAAPVISPRQYLQQFKMNYCNDTKIYENFYQQINASMSYIKQLCATYLKDRGNESFEDMSETWKLISLETTNPNRKKIAIENKLNKKIHDFYLNLHMFDQLIDYVSQDTNNNKTKIEHGEEISIDKIINFLQSVKAEIKFNMKEVENLLQILEIDKPDLADNSVVFNSNIGRRVRDFLIIKNLIHEFEHVVKLIQNYCENKQRQIKHME